MEQMLNEYYRKQEINPLKPPERPPIDNVYCIYGVNQPTEVGFHYKIIDETFRLKKSILEENGLIYSQTALLSRKTFLHYSNRNFSGDGTVPYNSLNWCKEWHSNENISHSETPTTVDQTSRLKGLLKMLGIEKLNYGIYRSDSFSKSENNRTKQTTVIELERMNHRDIIRSSKLLQIIKNELKERINVPFTPFNQNHQQDHQDHQDHQDRHHHHHYHPNPSFLSFCQSFRRSKSKFPL